jgi:hypothetical protein
MHLAGLGGEPLRFGAARASELLQAQCQDDQHDAHVARHRQEHLAQRLRPLLLQAVPAHLSQPSGSFRQRRHLRPEHLRQLLCGNRGRPERAHQQRRGERGRIQAQIGQRLSSRQTQLQCPGIPPGARSAGREPVQRVPQQLLAGRVCFGQVSRHGHEQPLEGARRARRSRPRVNRARSDRARLGRSGLGRARMV